MTERWLRNLKAAYDAGYYRTEPAVDRQLSFPWRNMRCGDCPFWMNDICQVTLTRCCADDIPCGYFDPPDHEAAKHVIVERLHANWRRWNQ